MLRAVRQLNQLVAGVPGGGLSHSGHPVSIMLLACTCWSCQLIGMTTYRVNDISTYFQISNTLKRFLDYHFTEVRQRKTYRGSPLHSQRLCIRRKIFVPKPVKPDGLTSTSPGRAKPTYLPWARMIQEQKDHRQRNGVHSLTVWFNEHRHLIYRSQRPSSTFEKIDGPSHHHDYE